MPIGACTDDLLSEETDPVSPFTSCPPSLSTFYVHSLLAPAPFILCDLEKLDLRQNNKYCPSERSALAALFQETKGPEWLNNANWTSPAHHCDWYGVGCTKDRKKVVSLTLVSAVGGFKYWVDEALVLSHMS